MVEDRDVIEQAADIRPRPRLHVVVHPDPGRASAAAGELARLLDPSPAETLRPVRSRWTVTDSRRAASSARLRGGPLILVGAGAAAVRDLDPLLKELETSGGRTVIIPTDRPAPSTLAGRGHTVVLAPSPARRRHVAAPSAAELRSRLAEGGWALPSLGGELRATCATPYGARLADAVLRSADDGDLPPQLAAELLIRRVRPPR